MAGTLQRAPAAQGPGATPEHAVRRFELLLRRTVTARLQGDRTMRGSADSGMELSQLAPYVPGDDPRRLDPAASARTGEPHVRRLLPERAVTTWLVVDVSPSMAFGTATRLKSDVAEGAADVLARLTVRHGGRVALVLAGEGGVSVPPRGTREALAGVRALLRSGVAADGSAGTLRRSLEQVDRLARTPGVVAVVSDFRDEGWTGPLRRLAARHDVLAVEVRDPLEEALPDGGLLGVCDPETGAVVEVDTSDRSLREAFAAAERERRAAVATALRGAGAQHVELRTDEDWFRELGRRLR